MRMKILCPRVSAMLYGMLIYLNHGTTEARRHAKTICFASLLLCALCVKPSLPLRLIFFVLSGEGK